MSTRTWLYERMVTDGDLEDLVPGGIFQTTAVLHTPHLKPYIIYRQTSDVSVLRGDGGDLIRRNGYMIFVHDVPGDYLQIDDILQQLKSLFQDVVDQPNGVVESLWGETSDDLRDDDMGTIMKFARIQVTYNQDVELETGS